MNLPGDEERLWSFWFKRRLGKLVWFGSLWEGWLILVTKILLFGSNVLDIGSGVNLFAISLNFFFLDSVAMSPTSIR